ncbi:MAG: type II toxin-antitoxin system VapC family toxin [Verrucomicrobia bacterium]|nr:type II toxin-antitoxin system VapC family toxin [Verrucomicrobiota bacterium]
MRRLRIYLDTSVINFLFAEDSPDFQKATVEFFTKYAAMYELYVSEIVRLEIGRTPDLKHRERLLEVLQQYPINILTNAARAEIEQLAKLYVLQQVMPAAKFEDALHVAYATVYQMDILLSWNFKHLANVRREGLITAVNQQAGYRYPLRLLSPLEVEDEGEA